MCLKTVFNYFSKLKEQFVVLELNGDRYLVITYSGNDMYTIGTFFSDDVGSDINSWIEFLDDPEEDLTSGDSSILHKHDCNNDIHIFSERENRYYLSHPVSNDSGIFIKISELRKLFHQWQELRSRILRPSKIKITEKCGVFNWEVVE